MLKGVRVVQHSDVSVELTRVSQDDSMPMCLSIQCRTHTSQHYPSQTQTLEGLTKDEIRISKEALFKGVSTRFGLRTIEKSIENPDFIFCSSFQNPRLGSINLTHTMMIARLRDDVSVESTRCS